MARGISRQVFLRAALGTAAAGALGSCRAPAPDSQTPSATPVSPSSAAAGPPDWTALEEGIDGKVIMPSNPDYATAKKLFNTRFDDKTPAAVVIPHSSADVQKAVEFAARKDIKVTVRSGGHSYIGASAA